VAVATGDGTLMVVPPSCERRGSVFSDTSSAGMRAVIEPELYQATPVVYKPFISETAALEETFSKMAVGMWHFSKFVPNAVVQGIIKDASVGSNGLGMAWQTVTVMFTDVKGFTGISENTPVDALVSKLQVYFGLLTSVIVAHEGTVDKYIGDGCMAFWNHPEPIENHQTKAVKAALMIQRTIAVQKLWETRVGIHTDRVLVGTMGCAARISYTALGDGVNVAARLESAGKYFSTNVLVSKQVLDGAEGVVARHLGSVLVKGKTKPTELYGAEALEQDAPEGVKEMCAQYSEAMSLYMGRQFDQAHGIFKQFPEDASAVEMAALCKLYLQNPPDAQWNGLHVLEGK
jgi:adenylate cyclase